MEVINLSPPASSLIESIRSIGYSFDAAIADIIDNSISADATEIKINARILENGKPIVEIIDNGNGMTVDALRVAMSLGGKGPSSKRDADDLGRFGLGLKTASFSQATILTVISKTEESSDLYGIEWDLDKVVESNRWDATQLANSDCIALLGGDAMLGSSGTYVRWSNCDRIVQDLQDIGQLSEHINRLIDYLKKRLSLIFHKYLEKSKVVMMVNGLQLRPMDPFAIKGGEKFAHSQILFKEERVVQGSRIQINGYLLPHISRMGGIEREREISIDAEHTASQGLYLYRLDRLIAFGGWQQIVRKTEANKLARLEICFGNDADHLWQLDIKKSTALLPVALRARLRDLVRGISNRSSEVFMRRVRMKKSNPNSVWERIYDKESKSISYQIDRSHPIIDRLLHEFEDKDSLVEDLLVFIQNTLPVDFISNDLVAGDGVVHKTEQEIVDQISELSEIVSSAGLGFEVFKETIIGCGMYKLNPHDLELLIDKFKFKFK